MVTEQQCGSVTAPSVDPMAEIKNYNSLIHPTNELPFTISYHGHIYREPGMADMLRYNSKLVGGVLLMGSSRTQNKYINWSISMLYL